MPKPKISPLDLLDDSSIEIATTVPKATTAVDSLPKPEPEPVVTKPKVKAAAPKAKAPEKIVKETLPSERYHLTIARDTPLGEAIAEIQASVPVSLQKGLRLGAGIADILNNQLSQEFADRLRELYPLK